MITGSKSIGHPINLERDLRDLNKPLRNYLTLSDWGWVNSAARDYIDGNLNKDDAGPRPVLESVSISCCYIELTAESESDYNFNGRAGAFFFPASSASTLTKLHIHVKKKFGLHHWPQSSNYTSGTNEILKFWNVKNLWVDIESEVNNTWLKTLAVRFPSVEDLRIDACFYYDYTQPPFYSNKTDRIFKYPWFQELHTLKKLQRMVLPWPREQFTGPLNECYLRGHPAPQLYESLKDLKKVVFFLRSHAEKQNGIGPDARTKKLVGYRRRPEDSNFDWETYFPPMSWDRSMGTIWYSGGDWCRTECIPYDYHKDCQCQE
ncbi:hypothetical protein TWF730_001647 [Orbilia blumenaviensis]|uniref:Uncharacterized protein n=1 Tax=Orbilia blumenaviensis TaxID=1796055 RepID=A0AAV9UPI3_9PEZI